MIRGGVFTAGGMVWGIMWLVPGGTWGIVQTASGVTRGIVETASGVIWAIVQTASMAAHAAKDQRPPAPSLGPDRERFLAVMAGAAAATAS